MSIFDELENLITSSHNRLKSDPAGVLIDNSFVVIDMRRQSCSESSYVSTTSGNVVPFRRTER